MITQATVASFLDYDPDTGAFTWSRSTGRVKSGSPAGRLNGSGYLYIKLLGRDYPAHRLAWLLTHGALPEEQLDHINGNRADNRLVNLRKCSSAENHQNRAAQSNSASGHIGVAWNEASKKWVSSIMRNGTRVHLGRFDQVSEAAEAYRIAKRGLHVFQPEVRAGACVGY